MNPAIDASLSNAAAKISAQLKWPLGVGLVLGSGLGALVERLKPDVSIDYRDIEGMPLPRVPGHSGRLHLANVGGTAVVCLQGRVHLYEGHTPERVVYGVRLLAHLGCSAVILTNAAGATSSQLAPGSLMLVADHLNLTGSNPLIDSTGGAQFVDMTNAYDEELREHAQAAANELDIAVAEGIYAGLLGPSYETPAEVRFLSMIGAQAVGMSTVLETIALRGAGVRVGALACITNAAAGVPGSILDHEHVQQVADRARGDFQRLVLGWIERLVRSYPAPEAVAHGKI